MDAKCRVSDGNNGENRRNESVAGRAMRRHSEPYFNNETEEGNDDEDGGDCPDPMIPATQKVVWKPNKENVSDVCGAEDYVGPRTFPKRKRTDSVLKQSSKVNHINFKERKESWSDIWFKCRKKSCNDRPSTKAVTNFQKNLHDKEQVSIHSTPSLSTLMRQLRQSLDKASARGYHQRSHDSQNSVERGSSRSKCVSGDVREERETKFDLATDDQADDEEISDEAMLACTVDVERRSQLS
mmetsp:Transcript_4890/g.8513  ORF Transcript_4890/g.8513 Transcript_4890/m.8513 type:complete len:240 (-) Transcript_4890:1887-2606(-)